MQRSMHGWIRLAFPTCLAAAALAAAAAPKSPAATSAPKSAPGASAPKSTAAVPAKPAPADAEIERNIRERFARSKISVDKFQVRVQGGVAMLEGKTEVVQRKGTATRLAKLGGARAVNNRIEVSQAARDKASENLQKGRRRAQVKRSETVKR